MLQNCNSLLYRIMHLRPYFQNLRHEDLEVAHCRRAYSFPSAEGLRIMIHYPDAWRAVLTECCRTGVVLTAGARRRRVLGSVPQTEMQRKGFSSEFLYEKCRLDRKL